MKARTRGAVDAHYATRQTECPVHDLITSGVKAWFKAQLKAVDQVDRHAYPDLPYYDYLVAL